MTGRRKGKGSRRSARDWRSLLAKFAGSGLGVGAFCQREAISAASFYRWRHLLSVEDLPGHDAERGAKPAFVDLGIVSAAPLDMPRLELKLALGEHLTLHLVRR